MQLDECEQWLVAPEFVDEAHFILRPCVKTQALARPNSYSFRTPLFAPLLTVAPFDTLEEAVAFVNSLDSVTSGLQSLDEEEQRYWKNNVKVGNLYINRGITGAVVGRQPFGGMKGLASGGPNYLLQFMNVSDKEGTTTDYRKSYAEWYEKEFRHARNLHPEIRGEQNVFRYLPLKHGMLLRLIGDETKEQVEMVACAAKTVGTPLTISADKDNALLKTLDPAVRQLVDEEPMEELYIKGFARVRIISAQMPQALVEAAKAAKVPLCQGAPVKNGRVELLRYLSEQSISNEYHRYGSQIEVPPVE